MNQSFTCEIDNDFDIKNLEIALRSNQKTILSTQHAVFTKQVFGLSKINFTLLTNSRTLKTFTKQIFAHFYIK